MNLTAEDPRNKVYEPRGAALDLMYCHDTEVLIEGPAGTGKSRGALEKVNLCMLKYPGSRALICRKTRSSMSESVLVTLEKVLPENPKLYPRTDDILRRVRQLYVYPNGSSIVVGGLDNTERIMSTEYDLVVVFEATEILESEWEMLLSRLRNGVMPYQQAIADCNPGAPTHWLNRRPNKMGMTRLLSRHEHNPLLFDPKGITTEQGEKYLAILDRLTGPRYMRLRKGKWVAAEGMVYKDYDAAIHLIDRFRIPKDWRRIVSIDLGYTNPFVAQWWAIDHDGRMYLYRQIYMSRRITEEHAKGVYDPDDKTKLLHKGIVQYCENEEIEAIICDHDRQERETLDRHGVYTIPAYKPIEHGIQAVTERLKIAGDGKARLFIMRDSLVELDRELEEEKLPTKTEDEFDGYVTAPRKEDHNVKEIPVDKDNHGMDAMRYAVAYVDDIANQQFEFSGGGISSVEK